MFFKIQLNEDIEKVAGIFVKNGYEVKRASVPGKNKKKIHGIEVLDSMEVQKEDDEE